jgi:hypothetical protein
MMLDDAAYARMVARAIGVDPWREAREHYQFRCPLCGNDTANDPFHAQRCRAPNTVDGPRAMEQKRHADVLWTAVEVAHESGAAFVEVERKHVRNPRTGEDHVMDLYTCHRVDGRFTTPVGSDVKVTDIESAPRGNNAAAAQRDAFQSAVVQGELEKENAYKDGCDAINIQFTPLSFDSEGNYGRGVTDFARHYCGNLPAPRQAKWLLRMSIATVRGSSMIAEAYHRACGRKGKANLPLRPPWGPKQRAHPCTCARDRRGSCRFGCER